MNGVVDIPKRKYDLTEEDKKRLENNFTYHAPNEEQRLRYMFLREDGKAYAYDILRYCPPSRERERALEKLDEVVMLANAAMTRNE